MFVEIGGGWCEMTVETIQMIVEIRRDAGEREEREKNVMYISIACAITGGGEHGNGTKRRL